MNLLQFVYQTLDESAQKAAATPDIKMGLQPNQNRTLGETNLISSNSDVRYSLSASIFGWSERAFWRLHWYNLYKDNFADKIDEKVLRIAGAFGAKWRALEKKDIECRLDPDVFIESKNVSRAEKMEERNALSEYFGLVLAEPTTNRRYGLKKLGRLYGMQKDEIDRLLPPTVDERLAERENDMLNEDKITPVQPEDDHNVHLEIHSSAKDTPAAKAHSRTHEEALMIKKVHPELFPQDPNAANMNDPQSAQTMADAGAGMGQQQGVSPSMVA
jgi:hypothetical protein